MGKYVSRQITEDDWVQKPGDPALVRFPGSRKTDWDLDEPQHLREIFKLWAQRVTSLDLDQGEATEPTPIVEDYTTLISSDYILKKPVQIHVYRYNDGVVLIRSLELNLYAEGDSEYLARREFSDVLVDELEDLEQEGIGNLGSDLQLRLALLQGLIGKIDE